MTVLYPEESADSPRNTFWGNELLSAWREREGVPLHERVKCLWLTGTVGAAQKP